MPLLARVPSTDGVAVAVHDLGGLGPTLLISHATGFHGRCYAPIAHALAESFHSIAFDHRGHGHTPQPWDVPISWERYGQDTLAVVRSLDGALDPLVAFGHSMGGATLLMAAHADPARFVRLVLFEPIVFPPEGVRPSGTENPMVVAARRRRTSFDSFDAALANFTSKPPLSSWTAEALDEYVRHGFHEGEDGRVHLACPPEVEAGTFELGATHRTWDLLPDIEVPVTVVAGRVEEMQPSRIAAEVADRLPAGRYVQLDEVDHFGPMSHPDLIAAQIRPAR